MPKIRKPKRLKKGVLSPASVTASVPTTVPRQRKVEQDATANHTSAANRVLDYEFGMKSLKRPCRIEFTLCVLCASVANPTHPWPLQGGELVLRVPASPRLIDATRPARRATSLWAMVHNLKPPSARRGRLRGRWSSPGNSRSHRHRS
jgi:hypothetical protein